MNEQINLLFLVREERWLKFTKDRGREGYSGDEAGGQRVRLPKASFCYCVRPNSHLRVFPWP